MTLCPQRYEENSKEEMRVTGGAEGCMNTADRETSAEADEGWGPQEMWRDWKKEPQIEPCDVQHSPSFWNGKGRGFFE